MNKENQKILPKTWKEWVKNNNQAINEFFINDLSEICRTPGKERELFYDDNLLSSHEDAKGLLALIKLKRLRDTYNNGEIDFTKTSFKYCIVIKRDEIVTFQTMTIKYFLSFKTKELRDEFLNNFRDLIIEAKMWL